ncbi:MULTISPECIES: DUF6391 domain-containing protein [Nostoc]|jgi:hypothetical protein|uniref:Uncharacterized protein n=1 Tax=Nostoc punctiforme FACHB-252 TaxID=1357509 RepID=A0ABR8HG84_NOSPU|nr:MULTISPECIES: DUF6391 domain-containing protein [Nostoc]MBC1242231.1 hypothetical protein [Nostoc sp. 2RC]MBD2614271.1 hypothetical protein [Nostoc punctiforme FACHB-252]MBL1197498.1 hypothetical protein [Nostoc sp. GBBB01]MDZ8014395.1 DUF6391 domain-containing protein [Nostoc sp. ZfuVER08]
MNTSASFQGGSFPFEFWNFDLTTPLSGKVPTSESQPSDFPYPTQDTDLLRQLSFIPGLKEILMLRQVHALEHATVWVLSESNSAYHTTGEANKVQLDNELLGGLSTEQGFYLYGEVNISDLRRAVALARHRITSGEWDLAVHPRCGTNLSVAMVLTAGLAMGVHLLLPFRPVEQIIGLGLAATTAAEIAPDLGSMVQRYLTTAIPFNLTIENIIRTRDLWGREAHFVKVKWQE